MANDTNQELKIHIVSDADNSGFKSTANEAENLSREQERAMGVISVSQADVEAATKKTTDAVKEETKKFSESKGEIREVGNELGNMAGVAGAGRLGLGAIGAAAFGVSAALEILKSSWEEIQQTINGPIKIGLPEDAPKHISAAATAWEQYAKARAAAMASDTGAEGAASAREKQLANELQLIKQVLSAEKEKALADLELQKGQMTPEAYAASRANIGNIFDEAGTAAEHKNRNELAANKYNEAFALEIEAREKTQRALAIKAAPEEVAKNNQAALDANATNGQSAKKEIEERIALIDRLERNLKGEPVAEYEGAYGKLKLISEGLTAYQRYGGASFGDMRGIETPRLAQAQAAIDTAEAYRQRQAKASAERDRLMTEAGDESGRAASLRDEAGRDSAFNRAQSAVDSQVAGLHQSSVKEMAGASSQTVMAVQKFTATVVGGFRDVHKQMVANQQELDRLRASIATVQRIGAR